MKKWTSQEETLATEMLKSGKTYEYIATFLERTPKSVKVKFLKLGLSFRNISKEINEKFCECCGNTIVNNGIKFCSSSCSAKINNSLFPKRGKVKEEVSCLSCGAKTTNENSFCCGICKRKYELDKNILAWKNGEEIGYSGKDIKLKKFIRNHLIYLSENKCSQCGWNKIHPITGKVPLEINHIDGDAKNCRESNLEVLCANCHSLTPNFRALNKNSSRKNRSLVSESNRISKLQI